MNRLYALFVVFLISVAITACTPASSTGGGTPVPTVAGQPDAAPTPADAAPAGTVNLNIAVTMNAQALQTFERGLDAIRAEHPEWTIDVEAVPQEGRIERITTAIASQTLPDLVLVDGLTVQQWIRQGAFADLSPFVAQDDVDMSDFYPGTVEQFSFQEKPYAIPYDAAPEVVYFNKEMFDAAGVEYPNDEWTYDDMREAALLLTLDAEGRNASDPDFDPSQVVQWGWNSTPNHIWSRHFIQARGADYCVNDDCTVTDFTSPEVVEAFRWWAEMASVEYTAPYDVYTGAQTGVPGDPFQAGVAAMGFNNIAFAPGINAQSEIQYDVVQPFIGTDGQRYGPISTQAWVMSATSQNQDAAWALLRELTSEEFLTEFVAKPGHGIPALRAAAPAAINPENPPANQQAALDAMEYETVFHPFTASAFETYGKTSSLFVDAMKGERPLEEVLAEIEAAANETLAKDIVE